jgi:hypothetical protein
MSASEIVNKVWNYAHVLRDQGISYGDYRTRENRVRSLILAFFLLTICHG